MHLASPLSLIWIVSILLHFGGDQNWIVFQQEKYVLFIYEKKGRCTVTYSIPFLISLKILFTMLNKFTIMYVFMEGSVTIPGSSQSPLDFCVMLHFFILLTGHWNLWSLFIAEPIHGGTFLLTLWLFGSFKHFPKYELYKPGLSYLQSGWFPQRTSVALRPNSPL